MVGIAHTRRFDLFARLLERASDVRVQMQRARTSQRDSDARPRRRRSDPILRITSAVGASGSGAATATAQRDDSRHREHDLGAEAAAEGRCLLVLVPVHALRDRRAQSDAAVPVDLAVAVVVEPVVTRIGFSRMSSRADEAAGSPSGSRQPPSPSSSIPLLQTVVGAARRRRAPGAVRIGEIHERVAVVVDPVVALRILGRRRRARAARIRREVGQRVAVVVEPVVARDAAAPSRRAPRAARVAREVDEPSPSLSRPSLHSRVLERPTPRRAARIGREVASSSSPSLSRPSLQAGAAASRRRPMRSRSPDRRGRPACRRRCRGRRCTAGSRAFDAASTQPGSAGKSISVSPSLSRPSSQAEAGGVSTSSDALAQSGSARSTSVSASLSRPSSHCGFSRFDMASTQPGSAGKSTSVSPSLSSPSLQSGKIANSSSSAASRQPGSARSTSVSRVVVDAVVALRTLGRAGCARAARIGREVDERVAVVVEAVAAGRGRRRLEIVRCARAIRIGEVDEQCRSRCRARRCTADPRSFRRRSRSPDRSGSRSVPSPSWSMPSEQTGSIGPFTIWK